MRRPRTAATERRARRLARIYPAGWRARYGDEFVQFLIDDITERPVSVSRFCDVVGGGLRARAAHAGLDGDVLGADRQLRAGLAALGLLVMGFLVAGIAVWAQLTVGWQWSAPNGPGTQTGMLVMSATMLGFALVGAAAVAPLVWAVARELLSGGGVRRLPWLALLLAGAACVIAGSVHFGHHWPGTGGHAWSGRGLVPGVVARFCWAATLWVTSYWAHPHALSAFPAPEIAWMIVGPLALAAMVLGSAGLLARVALPRRVLVFETWVGLAGIAMMALFLAGAASWVLSASPSPHGLFRVGAIDIAAVSLMAAVLVMTWRFGRRNVGLSRQLAVG